MRKGLSLIIMLVMAVVVLGAEMVSAKTDCGAAANYCSVGADLVEHVCLWNGGSVAECNHQWIEQYNECMAAANCPMKILP